MNAEILKGRWNQIKGDARQWWGKLTDSDLDLAGGDLDKLIGILQERYGWAKEQAQQEVERRLAEYEKRQV